MTYLSVIICWEEASEMGCNLNEGSQLYTIYFSFLPWKQRMRMEAENVDNSKSPPEGWGFN